jgi:ABC-2 type transport system ATP-binding protein
MVDCQGVWKQFRWYDRGESLKANFARLLRKPGERYEWFALSDVNFNVRRGERVGLIGRNGSGKTTLLRLISGIYAPTRGSIARGEGKALALLELGAGFYNNLSARENIRLNWAFNGLPLSELTRKFDDIVAFAGFEQFLDTPLKYYSSGMRARLGFAIAAHAEPDLLIVDEVLTVGDEEFQEMCHDRIEALCARGTTLILVSHYLDEVVRMCDRTIWLEKGRVQFDGPSGEARDLYRRSVGSHQ